MPDNVGIEELMTTLNTDPTTDDHEPEVPEEKPEIAAVADLAAKFTASLTDMSANQKLIFDSLLEQMEKNKTPAVAAPPPPPVAAQVFVPNPAYDSLKESDPDIYSVMIANDKDIYDRHQQMMSVINKQADQIDNLVEANNNNLEYLEESVVGAKHADAAKLIKTPEFTAWVDDQNQIVKDAYKKVVEGGTTANRIKLLDLFKEQIAIDKDKDAAALSAATKDAEVEKAKLPAPGSLTDFESSKKENVNVSLLELASDPDRVNAYLATANGDPDQIQKLSDNLAKAIAAEM